MNVFVGLLLSIVTGLFLLVGTFIVFKSKNSEKVVTFSVSIGLIVLILLSVFHLIPEAFEFLSGKFTSLQSYAYLFLMILVGMIILKVLDYFIPEHDSDNKANNLKHIALITFFALFIHNFIEGMALYMGTLSSIKTGIMLCIGIALHNVPLGLTISSAFYKENKNKFKTVMYIIILGLSTFMGALSILVFDKLSNSSFSFGTILGITVGMIMYILVFELWPVFRESKYVKLKVAGLLIGGAIMLLTTLL